MDFEEGVAKRVLSEGGLAVPRGQLASSPEEAAAAAARLGGAIVVKAQVLTGKRGKAGGILFCGSPREAAEASGRLLGSKVDGHRVDCVLVEERVAIARELYAAVMNDPDSRSPLFLFSTKGGMDIEEIAAVEPESLLRLPLDIRSGLEIDEALELLEGTDLGSAANATVSAALATLYRRYRDLDAELLEVNPLAITVAGGIVAIDAKLTLDDAALSRHSELAVTAHEMLAATGTHLERRGRELGLTYIELDGEVGVLANGAGLTMTTMDVITLYGGRPANFLEIGGANYTQALPALKLLLDNPRVKSVLVNFCGAFARTDVMALGVIEAWEELRPQLPAFFSIHGTGEDEAIRMLHERLGIEPFDSMDDAVRAAVGAANTM